MKKNLFDLVPLTGAAAARERRLTQHELHATVLFSFFYIDSFMLLFIALFIYSLLRHIIIFFSAKIISKIRDSYTASAIPINFHIIG